MLMPIKRLKKEIYCYQIIQVYFFIDYQCFTKFSKNRFAIAKPISGCQNEILSKTFEKEKRWKYLHNLNNSG